MPIFEPNKPVRTLKPAVQVENELKPGTYTFELVVLSADGTKSEPVRRTVMVVEAEGGGGGATPRSPKRATTARTGKSGGTAGTKKKKSATGGQSRTTTGKPRTGGRKAKDK